MQLKDTNAATISEAILKFLGECNLDLSNLRGQGYDRASVIAGKVAGVSTRILEKQDRALYFHCRAHSLNLVIAASCKHIPEVRNQFDSVGSLTWFLGASPKRKAILQKYLKSEDISDVIVDDSLPEEDRELADKLVVGSKQKQVPRLCETRWSA